MSNFYRDIIQPKYFSDPIFVDLCRIIFDHQDKYKESPTIDILRQEINDLCSRSKQKIKGDYIECLDLMSQNMWDIEEYEYIKDKILSFGKRQALVDAIMQSANILEREPETKYVEIEKLIKSALLVGENSKNLGINFFENMAERFFSYSVQEDVIERIPTGITKLDGVLGGGLGRTELGVVVAAPGRGKALDPNTQILTPKGYQFLKYLKIGDSVISVDGSATKITGIFNHENKKMYRVKFQYGGSCICCDEHLWTVKFQNDKSWQVLPLFEIIKNFVPNSINIPTMMFPCEFESTQEDLPIEPKALGSLYFNHLANQLNAPELGLFKIPEDQLFIPKRYLLSTPDNRLDLLEGILNTRIIADSIYFKTKSKQLAEDVKFLSESLGFLVSNIVIEQSPIEGVFDCSMVIHPVREGVQHIKSIEYIGNRRAICITVDHPSSLYVIKDGIVTHNTTVLISIGAAALEAGYNVLHISLENNEKQIARNYDVRLLHKDKQYIKDNPEYSLEIMNNIRKYRRGQLRIKKYPTKTITVRTIRALLDSYKTVQDFEPTVLILDYGALLKPVNNYADKRNAIESNFEEMRALADDYNLALWSAAQGNRGALSKKVVTMSDLAECFAIANIADVMVCLCQTIKEKVEGKLRLFMPKIRDNADTMMLSGTIEYPTKKIEMLELVDANALGNDIDETDQKSQKKKSDNSDSDEDDNDDTDWDSD